MLVRRATLAAQDPGHWRRLHPGHARSFGDRRDRQGQQLDRDRNLARAGAQRRHSRRHFVGRGDRRRACRSASGRKRWARRSLPSCRRFGALSLDGAVRRDLTMADQPRRPRTLNDARTEAEAAFKQTTTKVAEAPPKKAALPGREGTGFAADRSGRARTFPGGRPRLAGPHQRGSAQSGGQISASSRQRLRTRTRRSPELIHSR